MLIRQNLISPATLATGVISQGEGVPQNTEPPGHAARLSHEDIIASDFWERIEVQYR